MNANGWDNPEIRAKRIAAIRAAVKAAKAGKPAVKVPTEPTSRFTGAERAPLVVAYGAGVDSTAILVGLWRRGIRPDKIMFANVGSEFDETYEYLPVINAWLRSIGFPEVEVVQYVPTNFKHWPPYYSLEQNCLTNGTLPSKAFGFGSCSQKWKAAPQHKHLQAWAPAVAAWARGQKVRKVIGYDCSMSDKKRRAVADKMVATYTDNFAEFYDYWYPLQEWGWDREECKRQVAAAGLPVPHKSSCFFCPAIKPAEVDELPYDKLQRIVLMEARAKPRLDKVEGLWRKAVKGCRGAVAHPGSIAEYIAQKNLLPAAEIARLQTVPTDLIDYQAAFAAGATTQTFEQFIQEKLGESFAA